jgi:hypothetical protein
MRRARRTNEGEEEIVKFIGEKARMNDSLKKTKAYVGG